MGTFELVAALVWRAVAAIRGPGEEEATRTVTVVKTTDPAAAPTGDGRLGLTNEHRIGHVVAPTGLLPAHRVLPPSPVSLVTMTRNEAIARHGSVESSWSSRSGDTIRPYGRQGSLRGTPVTVKTSKDLNQYV